MRIYGIPEDVETLSEDRINEEVTKRVHWIWAIERDLGRASGGAYSQDLWRIEDYSREIGILKSFL